MSELARRFELENKESNRKSYENLYETMLTASGSIDDYTGFACNVFSLDNKLYKFSSHNLSPKRMPTVRMAIYDQEQLAVSDNAQAPTYALTPLKHRWQLTRYETEVSLTDTEADYRLNLFGDIAGNVSDYSHADIEVVDNHEINSIEEFINSVIYNGELVYREPNIHPDILTGIGSRLHDHAQRLLNCEDSVDSFSKTAHFSYIDSNITLEAYGDFEEDGTHEIDEITAYVHPTSRMDLIHDGGHKLGQATIISYSRIENVCIVEKLWLAYDDELDPITDENCEFISIGTPEIVSIGAQNELLKTLGHLQELESNNY